MISNNYLEGSTENFLLGGADPGIFNLVPTGVTFTAHVAKPVRGVTPSFAPLQTLPPPSVGGTIQKATYGLQDRRGTQSRARHLGVSAPQRSCHVDVKPPKKSVSLSWTGDPTPPSIVSTAPLIQQSGGVFRDDDVSFVDSGGSRLSGAPAATGGQWLVKNLLELKTLRTC